MRKWFESKFERILLAVLKNKRAKVKVGFKRVLPLHELIADRWEKAEYLGFEKGASVYDACYVFGDVKVGANTWVGPFTVLDGTGGLTIGSNCSISAGVHIYTHSSVKWAVSGGKMAYEYAAVHIADNCFIGPHSIIQKGVTIGRCSVIAANSFVNNDVGEFEIAGGSPAKKIGKVKVAENGEYELHFNE